MSYLPCENLICHNCGHLCGKELVSTGSEEKYAVAFTCIGCGLRYPIMIGSRHVVQSPEAESVALAQGASRSGVTFKCPHCDQEERLRHTTEMAKQVSWWHRLRRFPVSPRYWFECHRCGFTTPKFPGWKSVWEFNTKVTVALGKDKEAKASGH